MKFCAALRIELMLAAHFTALPGIELFELFHLIFTLGTTRSSPPCLPDHPQTPVTQTLCREKKKG